MGKIILPLLLLGLAGHAYSYSSYQERVPNGNNVNHPCKANYRWPGLGHENPLGGGARNPFGLDFAAQGHVWSVALCQMDSDGDGRTNGQELGDPTCTWTQGNIPQTVDGITHPGVCEPFDSAQCQGKNDFVSCELDKFENCATINNPQVMRRDLRFPITRIPNTETNYYCMTFDLAIDQDYHLIAYEPLVDNANILHHILLYGCKDPNGVRIPEPELCSMSQADNDCTDVIGTWAVGIPGVCLPENLGFRIGRSGYTRVRLETHYHNPNLRADYTDQSGLRLFYQPSTPQMNDLAILMTGQTQLEIPPGQPRIEFEGLCGSNCTRQIVTKPAYITTALNHMHYLGRAMSMKIYRNGRLYNTLTDEEFYSYDNPILFDKDPFVELLPGDEIKTTCVFNSMSTQRWTYYGDGTFDEMCFGFLTFYPKDALVQDANCVSFGPQDVCQFTAQKPIGQCNWAKFVNKYDPETIQWWAEVEKSCNTNGFCRPECREILNVVRNHPCMKGEATANVYAMLATTKEGTDLLARMSSCGDEASCPTCDKNCPAPADLYDGSYVADGAAEMTAAVLTTIVSALTTLVL